MRLPQSPATPFLRRTLVLIPALDEEACVGKTVRAWRDLGAGRVRVVDNGSRDATSARALGAGAEVVSEPRRGYGAAAWAGLQNWPDGFDWVLFSSADGSDRLSAAEVLEWQRAVDAGADMVLGDRTAGGAGLGWVQRFGNWACCVAIARGWHHRFRDLASLRLVRIGMLGRLGLVDRGFGWNLEMQVRAVEHRLQMVELPVVHFPREGGRTKISGSVRGTLRAGLGILRMLGHLWMLRQAQGAPIVDASAAESR